MKQFTSRNQKIGEIGEKIACDFLIHKGFEILEQNYTLKSGEIDIIARRNKKLYFVEVKSIIQKTVSHETAYDPFQNISMQKIKRMKRAVAHYLHAHRVSRETSFHLLGIGVLLVPHGVSRVTWLLLDGDN